MKKYVCDTCGYVYDPEIGDPDNGIKPGTAFEDLPEDWVCPLLRRGINKILVAARERKKAPSCTEDAVFYSGTDPRFPHRKSFPKVTANQEVKSPIAAPASTSVG